jgi:hypothetical protein
MASRNQLRQSSLILGTGPGALTVLQDGSTVIIPGVDAWYVSRSAPQVQRIPNDVIVNDPQLQKNLGVDFFVLPPAEGVSEQKDTNFIPTTLFPTWLLCYTCNALEKVSEPIRVRCSRCLANGKKSRKMVQINFVVACEDGHLDEFPWVEWVHRGKSNVCSEPQLSFRASGVVQLSSQQVYCDTCKKRRNLSGTSKGWEDGTTELSRNLESSELFLCHGARPWLNQTSTACEKQILMVLRSSSNIYFASTVSSILVPSKSGRHSDAMARINSSNRKGTYLGMLFTQDYDYSKIASAILVLEGAHYKGVSEVDLAGALSEEFPHDSAAEPVNLDEPLPFDRTPEWEALSQPREDGDMVVRLSGSFTDHELGLSRVHAVPLLKKTTALKGFTRLKPRDISAAHGRQLQRREPFSKSANWLPAIQQTGEGIFITLDSEKLDSWASSPAVTKRAQIVTRNLISGNRTIPNVTPDSKFLLLHTLAHVLIQELVIECGYTSAALTERIYSEGMQSGILIYTASSSADGTMGGLVEMSETAVLVTALENALSRARWCSNDPVCMELGKVGQGNSGSNLAACHSCCLLPETSCEHFNQGLDRGLLIGDTTNGQDSLGFFENIA